MQVILLKDVPKTGKKFDVKEVSQGFGMNFLIKNGLAKVATKSEIEKVSEQKRAEEVKSEVQKELIHKALKEIEGKGIALSAKANDKGHLFSAIHEDDILNAIKEQLNIELDKNWIKVNEPIKETGDHNVTVSTGEEKVNLIVTVQG
ncbi:MAG TPA: 50S ribosomal protein L9 [Vampirovibrionales bacterium]